MKYIFQIPIFLLMLWASGVSYATSACVDLGNSDIEAYVTNACSDGSATGAIDLQINDGTAEFEIYYYDASGHLLNPDNAEDVSGLLPGTYSIEVIDSKCAKAEMEVEVGTSDPIVISATLAPICQIGKGSISPTITGGEGDYSFVWSNGATTQNIENLSDGIYTLKVKDKNNCVSEKSFTLANSSSPFIFAENFAKQQPSSCSANDGYIATWRSWCITGGVRPFTYLWSNGATTDGLSNIVAGTYTVTVTGADGCTGVKSEELEAQNDIKIEFEEIVPTCPNASEGYILLITDQDVIFSCPQLGIAPDFNPDNPNTFELSNLPSGEYCIGLEAINGTCKKEKCYQINDIPNEGPLNITGNITKSCKGKNNGNISIKVTGGYSQHPYSTTWSQNYTGSLNLGPGTYTVTVTDNCGTTASSSFVVTNFDYEPIKIESNYERIDDDDYLVFNAITGGSGSFKYIWEYYSNYENNWKAHSHTKKDYKISLSKQYRITVIDKVTGCSETKIYDCISTKEEVTNTCPGWDAGAIYIYPEYPLDGLKYNWSNGSTSQNILDLAKGKYSVTITSDYGCILIKDFEVNEKNIVTSTPYFKLGTYSDTDQCGWYESCNKKPVRFIEYDFNNPEHVKKSKNGITKGSLVKSGCRKEIVTCPATGTTLERELPYIYNFNWDLCKTDRICPNTGKPDFTNFEIGVRRRIYEVDNGWCTVTEKCVLHNPDTNEEIDIDLAYTPIQSCHSKPCLCCPESISASNVTDGNTSVIVFFDYEEKNKIEGKVEILHITTVDNKIVETVVKSWNVSIVGGYYSFDVSGLESGDYKVVLTQDEPCGKLSDEFSIIVPSPVNCISLQRIEPAIVNPGGKAKLFFSSLSAVNGVTPTVSGTIELYNAKSPKEVLDNNPSPEKTYSSQVLSPKTDGVEITVPEKIKNYIGRVIINGCTDSWFALIVEKTTEPPGITEDCDREFLNITNNTQYSFDTYWIENNVVKGAQFGKEDNIVKVNEKYIVSYTDHPIKTIKEDNIGNYISVSKYLNEIKKYNTNGNLIWQKEFQDFDILNISDGKTSNFNLVGFDNENFNYVSKTIDEDGNVIGENALSLPLKFYDILHQSGSTTTAYDKQENKLTFSTNSGNIEKSVPLGITIKDIKTLSSGNILVGGDFSGSINVAGEQFNSGEFKNAIFLTYSKSGNLLAGKPIIKARNETVKGIAVNDSNKAAYHGKYEEVVDISTNLIDSCVFIDIVDVGFCDTFPSILTYDHRTCQLKWAAPPSGYTTALQMEVNGVWLPAEKALGIDVIPVSPYAITKDGKYRLLSKKEGCPDIISNFVQTSCTASCTCEVPVLSYSANNCQLTWTNNCATYTVSLQRLNNVNIWETVVQQAVSPYNVQTNGQYRLYLSTSATSIGLVCPPVSSNTVTTSCTPSTNTCSCNAPTLSHNSTACTLTWSVSGCTGYTTTLQRSISGVWTSISASSPYTIPTGSNGQYRILTSKAGCTDLVSNIVNVTCSCSSPASITIFDYGTSGLGQNATIPVGQTYTHEVSQGAPDACDDSYIQLAFSSSVVNSSWNFYVNGTIAVMPGTVIGSHYVVDLYLPTPPSGGTADVFIQSPCGDFYQLHLVYDCAPGSNPCSPILVNISGDNNNSCSNLTVNATGGQSPYTYSVTGTGNLGTIINQSSANVDLSTLDASEAITLNVIVTDQNNCTGSTSFTYLRCATSCNGSICSSQPAVCNGTLNNTSGYNQDAVINFLVPNGVTEISVDLAPYSAPQSLDILINGNLAIDHVTNIYALATTQNKTNCQNQGINIMEYNIGEQIYVGGFRVYDNYKDYASHPLQVSPGDIITININHPNCANASNWNFKINCNGSGNKPSRNVFELPAQIDLDIAEPFVNNLSSQIESFRFFPNPFSKGINLEMNSDIAESVALQAYNTVGTLMFERKIELLKGVNLRYIDAFENVPSGVYIVKIKSPTKDYTTKVIRVD